jgi:dolichyl-phosphate-mannose-protein mannosyltransferase
VIQEKQAEVSDKPLPSGHKILSQEEKVEYRDQDGNILNEEQIKQLQGKVKFETKYETRTRVVDEQGQELPVPEGGWPADMGAGVAPPHPDVQGVDPETVKGQNADAPKDAAASRDGEKEAERSKAKPASEGQDATVRDEL